MAFEENLTAIAALKLQVAESVKRAQCAYGDEWTKWFRTPYSLKSCCFFPSAEWQVSIAFDARHRWWTFEVVRIPRDGREKRLYSKSVLLEEAILGDDIQSAAYLFNSNFAVCCEPFYDLYFYESSSPACPIGRAIEDSRPLPGSDLHEVRVRLNAATSPTAPDSLPRPLDAPQRINFREFF